MGSDSQQETDFASVKERLAEIADMVDDENLSLDDTLDLYEEAVALGLQASDLLEVGISPAEESSQESQEEMAMPVPEGQPTTQPAVEAPLG